MSVLGTIRPNDWEFPLFLHVLGALTLTVALLFSVWRGGSAAGVRLALRSLTLGVIPAWLVLRVSAEWIADKEGYADLDEPPDWIGIGYLAGDAGFLLILISTLLAWLATRKVRAEGTPTGTVRAAALLISLLLLLNLVALWAMTTKPG